MANLKKVVVVLLVITLVLSAISVVFNLVIYNMRSDNYGSDEILSSNAGNIGLVVESSQGVNGDYGG